MYNIGNPRDGWIKKGHGDAEMQYDFTSVVDRTNVGSAKWEQMRRLNPNVAPEVVSFSVADMELKTPPEITEGLERLANSVSRLSLL